MCATAQHWANMLAQKDEFYYQNPVDLGENLFAWPMPAGGQRFCPNQSPSSPSYIGRSSTFGSTPRNSNCTNITGRSRDNTQAVSGKDVAIYWYKTRQYYDYTKDPTVLHAHAGTR